MNYVIVGCGRVGASLAKLLMAEQQHVTVVDENPTAFKRLGTHFTGKVEVGTGIDYDVLARAGTAEADGFIAVTDGDNRNVMSALIAQRMFGIKKIVARIYDPPRGQLYRELGIETVCPTTIGAKIIRDRIMHSPFERSPSFDFGKLTSLCVTLRGTEEGLTLEQIEQPGLIRLAAVRRGGLVLIPSANEALHEGDEINAIVAPQALSEFALRFATGASPVKVAV